MKTLRCVASSLVIRETPGGADTGRRLLQGQLVTGYGESYDHAWTFVSTPTGTGWASTAYLSETAQDLTTRTLEIATGMSAVSAARWLPHVLEAAARFDFAEPRRLAMWLAQCAHESLGFSVLVENLNYSAEALRRTWPTRFPDVATANAYARKPERIANRAYGGRMGNGPEDSGDGWRFRGRGLIQLTGRDNYRACGAALSVDLEADPDLLAAERYAALSAGWFWDSRALNAFADAGDVAGVTRKINGGTIGLVDRMARWEKAKRAMGLTA